MLCWFGQASLLPPQKVLSKGRPLYPSLMMWMFWLPVVPLPELKRPVLLQIRGHPYWSLNPVPTWATISAPIRNYGLIQMKSPKLTSPDGSLMVRSNKLP